ncbi:COG4223 family protein [Methylovirgula sp. HY1]|uniref:COG4223 family protein n=1 Tax=Methylovirgula sp. HY1 TaxID=2822761 RepID=UPI001C5B311D|nr:hypothetical protein [Methylovirgula sp. HY1]QXX75572.1 Chromosome partition protein Smc [Methylovirgula sp. HY1]
MAEDAKAEGEESTGPGAAARGLQGSTAPRREKPVIEGEALHAETHAPPAEAGRSASNDLPNDLDAVPAAALSGPEQTAETESVAADAPAADTAAEPLPLRKPPASPRGPLWTLAAAIVIGALIGVGGALGLHSMETTPQKLVALDERVAALEQRSEAAAPRVGDVKLDRRVGTLQSHVQSMAATLAGLQQTVQHLETMQSRLETAQKQAAQQTAAASRAPSAAPVDLTPLRSRVSKLEAGLAALDLKLGDLATKFAAQSRAAQAAKDHAAHVATARAGANAVAIIAANLRREVESGAGFADDLSALANQGFDKSKLVALTPVAPSGVATPAMLAKQFAAAAPDIMATEPEPKGEGFFGRLARDAEHLVRIQKIGDTSGHDLAAQVARIQAALGRSAVETALREWNGLPADAKAKSQAFGAAAQHRVDALSAAKAIEADALAALGKVKS